MNPMRAVYETPLVKFLTDSYLSCQVKEELTLILDSPIDDILKRNSGASSDGL